MQRALFALILSLTLFGAGFHSSPVLAAKKKVSKKATKTDVAWERKKKLLGLTSEFPTYYAAKNPNFFVRGALIDYKQTPNSKEWELLVLPLEILNNPNHYITLDHYKTGIPIKLELSSADARQLKKGAVIEYNFYTKEIPGEQQGHARLIQEEIHEEFRPYGTSPVAYLSKADLEPEQKLNAIKGCLLYAGNIEKDETTQSSVAKLSTDKNPELSAEAKKLNEKLFGK